MQSLGHTRGARRADHLLHTPDCFVRTSLPGLVGGFAIIHTSPAVGAGFAQCTLEWEQGGSFLFGRAQCLLYVLSGAGVLHTDSGEYPLLAGAYAYLPPSSMCRLTATEQTRIVLLEKDYVPLAGSEAPPLLVGHEPDLASVALLDNNAIQVRSLLPSGDEFDFAVNTMTYQPGASLPQVEMHVMEHGLLMLEGGGIYRLGDRWYPVAAGDFIWMASFCPQWFGALGKVPAKYLIYKDVNRAPLA